MPEYCLCTIQCPLARFIFRMKKYYFDNPLIILFNHIGQLVHVSVRSADSDGWYSRISLRRGSPCTLRSQANSCWVWSCQQCGFSRRLWLPYEHFVVYLSFKYSTHNSIFLFVCEVTQNKRIKDKLNEKKSNSRSFLTVINKNSRSF